MLQQLKPEWNEKTNLLPEEKISLLSTGKTMEHLFPFADELSQGINISQFSLSHLIQPDLFLRIRPGYEKIVIQKLKTAGVSYQRVHHSCIALPNATKIEDVIELNKEAVVQDYSSQQVGEFLGLVRPGRSDRVWDCCAGSGGKSIMAFDLNPKIELTVSDVRESILVNLKKRFEKAGIRKYESLMLDLSDENSQHSIFNNQQSIIIADVPCTGSGTWGRTPEQLCYFKRGKIEEYALLQRKIVSNALLQLKPGGHLLYITCSAFKKENEEMVDFLKTKFELQLIKMELLKGYDKKADTMFVALLQKQL